MNSQGIIYGPGVGKALAEWIVEGHPTMDLTEVDIARMGRWANNRRGCTTRRTKRSGGCTRCIGPGCSTSTAGVFAARRCCRSCERPVPPSARPPAGIAPPGSSRALGAEPLWIYDFDRPSWFEPVAEEMRATREGVALFDLSTYAKFIVQGPEAVAGLQHLCTSNIDVPIGRVVYTLICNERGGIEMDPTVTRLDDDRYLVLAPTLYQRRTEMLLRNGLPPGATVTDVTSGYATLHIAGPDSRAVLSQLTDQDLSNDAFPFLSAHEIDLGWAKATALRVSFTGELGWELLVPTEFAADVYDKVVAAGAQHGMRHAGAFAFDGFRWSAASDPGVTTSACSTTRTRSGSGSRCTEEGAFVGREALKASRGAPRERALVSVLLADPAPMLWHGEHVFVWG